MVSGGFRSCTQQAEAASWEVWTMLQALKPDNNNVSAISEKSCWMDWVNYCSLGNASSTPLTSTFFFISSISMGDSFILISQCPPHGRCCIYIPKRKKKTVINPWEDRFQWIQGCNRSMGIKSEYCVPWNIAGMFWCGWKMFFFYLGS